MRLLGALFVPLFAAACAAQLPHAEDPHGSVVHLATSHLPVDPTVHEVRFVPIAPPSGDRASSSLTGAGPELGVDAGGGIRSIEDGVRVLSLPGGGVLTSADRLPMAIDVPVVTPLPERLGGGFLFVVDATHVWRSEGWLAPARPIFTSRTPFLDTYGRVTGRIAAGLDRVYVATGAGTRAWQAIDGVTGKDMPLGPWPDSPAVGAYAALDGWRALALTDLRCVVLTLDAGATWRTLRLPFDPRDARAVGDVFDLSGLDANGNEVRYELRADGQAVRVPDARALDVDGATATMHEPTSPLGGNPLLAAIEDGWPAGDGTALVARDGALARVRLDDGTIAELAPAAYPLRPSRCHPIALGAPGGVGFVCGESRGATVLYALDPARGHLDEVRRFDEPRVVLPSSSGAVAVRGPCDAAAPGEETDHARHYCVRSRAGVWRAIRLEGNVGGERVVALGDGRVVVVSPPEGNLAAARLTVVDGEHARSVPIAFDAFDAISLDAERVLDVGVWLDGFEERRPGVVGGWIEASGTMLGVELDLEGHARLGPYVRDAGKTMVSGRYGLGWTPSLLGLETTDGGMTWAPLDVPAPIAVGRAIASRACGPVGCSASGWLKIGWGQTRHDPPEPPPARASARRTSVTLPLVCDATPTGARGATVDPLATAAPPATGSEDTLVPNETVGALVYAWGPKVGDWDRVAKWTVRWVWPFGGPSDARSTLVSPAPPVVVTAAKLGAIRTLRWSLLAGDDASHALLTTHRKRDEVSVFELEADHAPLEIERGDGEPFGELDAAIHAGGRWYLATASRPGERAEATVWEVDGPVAHPLARVPRLSDRAHAGLAWRADGKAIGVVVSGAPTSWPTRWLLPVDVDTGALGDVVALGAQDFGDRSALALCPLGASDDPGWVMDVPALFAVRIATGATGGRDPVTLGAPQVRARLSDGRVCVERLAGTLDPTPSPAPTLPVEPIASTGGGHATSAAGASLSVVATTPSAHERRTLRCAMR
jgi:hypothetical protein